MSGITEWRLLRGWSEVELLSRLAEMRSRPRNFVGDHEERARLPAWRRYGSRALVGAAPPGPPASDGPFALGRRALETFAFSDPAIVEAHFERSGALSDRAMLLELKVLGLHYLCGVVVAAVRSDEGEDRSIFGFRYDTLVGHLEAGSEWFLIEQRHATGEISFTIDAVWKEGSFPNFWSRWGFRILGQRYQRAWHTRAHARMTMLIAGARADALSRPRGRLLAHGGPQVVFTEGARC